MAETEVLEKVDTAEAEEAPPETTETASEPQSTETEAEERTYTQAELDAAKEALKRDLEAGIRGEAEQKAREEAQKREFDESTKRASYARQRHLTDGSLLPLIRNVEASILKGAKAHYEKEGDFPESLGIPEDWLRQQIIAAFDPVEYDMLTSWRGRVRSARDSYLKEKGISVPEEVARKEERAIHSGDPRLVLEAELEVAKAAVRPEVEKELREALKKEREADTVERKTAERQSADRPTSVGGSVRSDRQFKTQLAVDQAFARGEIDLDRVRQELARNLPYS